MHHDDVVDRAVAAAAGADRAAVTAAWVGSLSTRDLPARSALGSLAVLRHLPAHPFTPSALFHPSGCGVCGLGEQAEPDEPERVAGYPFQVRHTAVDYALTDLESFPGRAVHSPTSDDAARLARLVAAIRALPETSELTELRGAVQGVLPGNRHQRTILLETWGHAGILRPAGHDSHAAGWVDHDTANSRQPASRTKREWDYPVRFWTGADGVDEAALADWFGDYLREVP